MIDYKAKAKNIIAKKCDLEPDEINEDMYFEADLNLGGIELAELLEELEDSLKVDLLDKKADIESVGDLFDLLEEHYE